MSQPSYKIYPSLLQKFQSLLDVELEVNDFWNIDSDGNYKKTADEIAEKHEAELICMINREGTAVIEAASKGTAFNEVVDCLIENRGSSRDDIAIRSVWYDPSCKMVISGDPEDIKDTTGLEKVIEASLDGFTFYFNTSFCKEVSRYFTGSIPQYLCSAILPTQYGEVELYGYIDELRQDKVYDIKTTGYYQYGKFEKGWQKEVYPYCLIESGDCEEISEFEYTVVVWKELKGQPITGTMYKECYSYNHEMTRQRLTQVCERFIEWLEAHRDQITDKKIFGGENDEKPTLVEKPVLIEKHGVMTKEEFKALWEANDEGSGLTYDDIAANALAWGVDLERHPKCCRIDEVRYKVLKAAGVKDAEEYKPEDLEE